MAFGFFSNIRDLFGTEARDAKVMARVAEQKRKRLTELAADPARRKYVEPIERGITWHDEDIAFNNDPNATNVCEHLRPIEKLMRAEGIDLRIATRDRINANCLVNFALLKQRLPVNDSVGYIEPHIMDRSEFDPHSAIIVCSLCASSIFVVHSDVAVSETPWFPR